MPMFDEREKGQEAKYSQDQETTFRVTARRNKLLGLWAAEKLGMEGEAAQDYAREVIESDFEKPGDDDVLEKIMADFTAKSVDIGAHGIRSKMDALMIEAQAQVAEKQA